MILSPTLFDGLNWKILFFIDAEIVYDYIIGYCDDNQFQLNVYNPNDEVIEKIAQYPVSSIPFSYLEKKEAFYMNFTTDCVDKIAICYYMTDLIEIYSLDDPIFNFTVDTKSKKIYAISNSPEYHIVEYAYK